MVDLIKGDVGGSLELIERQAKKIFKSGEKFIFIDGDHLVSYLQPGYFILILR